MWPNKFNIAVNTIKEAWMRTVPVVVAPTPMPKPPSTGLTRVADDATTALGRHLQSLSQSLGQRNMAIGLNSVASFTASKGLEKAGKYLETEGFDGVVSDLGEQVKKNPLPFIAIGVGLGFLIGRILPGRRS